MNNKTKQIWQQILANIDKARKEGIKNTPLDDLDYDDHEDDLVLVGVGVDELDSHLDRLNRTFGG